MKLHFGPRRFVRFIAVGFVNTGFGLGVYWLLLLGGLSYPVASAGSLALGVLFSFKSHSALVFQAPGRFPRYLLVWTFIYVVNVTGIGLIRSGIGDFLAGLVLLPVNVVLAYLLMSRLVWCHGNAV